MIAILLILIMIAFNQNEMGVSVPMGKRVHAMILNGLGFINTRLYMFSKFFENKPLERLLGPGISAHQLNDDAIGRCLDEIYEYGCTKFFAEIASMIAIEKNLLGKSAHYDTTTIRVEGEYALKDDPNAINVTHGHSKDHRHDLKQITLLLTTTGKAGLPIWMEGLDGNASDKKTLKAAAERTSAFYSQNVSNANEMLWITRVPETLLESSYGGVPQRWLLIFSQKGFNREIKTLERQILKEKAKIENQLWHLGAEFFKCQEDAEKALKEFAKPKYHQVKGAFHLGDKSAG